MPTYVNTSHRNLRRASTFGCERLTQVFFGRASGTD
jgi:hypothetical protein